MARFSRRLKMPEVNVSFGGKNLKFDHVPSWDELVKALKEVSD